jgi:hypothetical protein
MPIRPFPAGQAFEPEVIREMSFALEAVCGKLNLALTDDPTTRLVASKIIELAQRGVRDAASLTSMTLKEFKHYGSVTQDWNVSSCLCRFRANLHYCFGLLV